MCHKLSNRSRYIIAFLIAASLVGFSLYMEYGHGLEPCPLCILQRVLYAAIMLICLAAFICAWQRFALRVYAALCFICAGAGLGVASRQVWLQHLPASELQGCGPSLGFMLKNFPIGETAKMLLTGTAECGQVQWTLFGLSMAGWSVISFGFFVLFAVYQFVKATKKTEEK